MDRADLDVGHNQDFILNILSLRSLLAIQVDH